MRRQKGIFAGRALLPAAAVGLALLAAGTAGCKGSKPRDEAAQGAPAAAPGAPPPAAAPGEASPAAAPAAPAVVAALPPVAEPTGKAALPTKPGPGAIAVVNGEEIADRTFADDLAAASLFAKQASEKGRREVLDRRIDFMLQIQDARRLGFLDRPMVKRMIERVRRGYVAAKVRAELAAEAEKIAPAEVEAAMRTLPPLLDLTVILADSEEEGRKAIARVKAGEDMEAVAREVSLSPGIATGSARRPGFKPGKGMYPPATEEAIAALEVGEISAPLETPVGFLVARLDARREPTEEDRREERDRVRQRLFAERASAMVRDVVEKAGRGVTRKVILAKIADAKLPDQELNPAAVWRALEEIGLAEIDGQLVTLGDAFHDVMDYNRFLKKRREDWQAYVDTQRARAEQEILLAKHGRSKGFDKLPEVEAAMREYVAALLSAQYVADLVLAQGTAEKLDEAAVRAFFEERKEKYPTPDALALSQILVRREGEAAAVRDRLRAGGDFAALAKEYSVDKSAAQGGDLGLRTGTELDKLWGKEMTEEIVARAKKGERGPFTLRSTAGYHVILVRDFMPEGSGKYEAVREPIRQVYLKSIQTAAVTDRMAALRKAAVIGVDDRKVATLAPSAAAPGSGSPHGGAMTSPGGPSPHGGGGRGGGSPHGFH